jgi:hypothetical protein
MMGRFQDYLTFYLFLYLVQSIYINPHISVEAIGSFGDYSPAQFLKNFKSKHFVSESIRTTPSVQVFSQSSTEEVNCASNSGIKNRRLKIIMTPLLLFFTTISDCKASALNPQTIALQGPFFQGWLCRTTDHINGRSFILIIGSFSGKRTRNYDEHYIFCGLETEDQGTLQFEAFPPPETVTITGSAPNIPFPIPVTNSPFSKEINITWSAADIGYFRFNNEECEVDFKLAGSHIKFSSKNRLPWSRSHSHSAGPEGWLGYTSLLPCHYFVHSVGSECKYSLEVPSDRDPKNYLNENDRNRNKNELDAYEDFASSKGRKYEGTGYTHIEGNHGTAFPGGWVWAQAIKEDNQASFSLTGGKFEIGVFTPVTFILFVRIGDKTKIFRTTGLDKFNYNVDGVDGFVNITAYSLSKRDRVDLVIRPTCSIAGGSFGPPLYIPTTKGFSKIPGCIETYTAVANIVISEYDSRTKKIIETDILNFPLSALEFGGSFQGMKVCSKKNNHI